VTGSYGAAVGANTKPTSGCRAVFTWRGRPKKKKENKTQIIIMTIIIMEEEEEEGGPFSLLFFLSFTWPAFSFLDDQIQWLRGRGENCYHRVKSQGKKKKRKEKRRLRESSSSSVMAPTAAITRKGSADIWSVSYFPFSLSLFLSLSVGGPARTADRQTERREKKKRVWLLLLCGIEEERERERTRLLLGLVDGPCWRPHHHHATTRSQRIEIVFSFFSVSLFVCLAVGSS
jgi:hypothetical protein